MYSGDNRRRQGEIGNFHPRLNGTTPKIYPRVYIRKLNRISTDMVNSLVRGEVIADTNNKPGKDTKEICPKRNWHVVNLMV